MRDFPVFTTEYGVGSLVLKEIPYSGTAYITIHDATSPELFLEECTDFCRAVGAEQVYASGHRILESYPFYTSVIEMSASLCGFKDTDACLFPVTEQTMSKWREIYNQKMAGVPNAAYMSIAGGNMLLKRGGGYFIHRNGELLGIGIVSDDRIDCVASIVKGSGADIVLALAHALFGEIVKLQVASTNLRAINLYEKLGFIKVSEISRWYKII